MVPGLGHLNIETILHPDKSVRQVAGTHLASGQPVRGYEIHLGETSGPDTHEPWLEINGVPAGAVGKNGLVFGAYVHGLFASDGFRQALLSNAASALNYEAGIEAVLDRLANHLASHIDMDQMLHIAQRR